ncbi:unnamed protein product [Malus baccata var. baccata]
MADNVFGNAINNETLSTMPEYQKTRLNRARMALSMKDVGEKSLNARTYVEKLKEQSGNGVATLCLVYNATGDTIRYAYKKDWFGEIWRTCQYPPQIANGQWGAFLHVKIAGDPSGSNAAVVYRGLNNVSDDCDWLLSWSNPWNTIRYDNTVYTEVRKAGGFDTAWDEIYREFTTVRAKQKHKSNGCVSIMETGKDTSPIVKAILTLEHAEEAQPT